MRAMIPLRFRLPALLLASLTLAAPVAAAESLAAEADRRAADVLPKVISWRRDIHQHPELGNRETRTAALVAAHLRSLGYEVRTGVAHTGVVAVLRGGKPGPVVGLRAEMDALPVTEAVDLPFASKVRTTDGGREVGVMHACGHDAHTAILMGVAEVLAGMRARLPGTVKLFFQPAEEGTPEGEDGGARMMIAEGALDAPKPAALFALHVFPAPPGTIAFRAGGTNAGEENFHIAVRGRQTHAAMPWSGVDSVALAAQIILALDAIPGRQLSPFPPSIVSVAMMHGGVRSNILPEAVELEGTVRYLEPAQKDDLLARIRRTAAGIAAAGGGSAEVRFTSYGPANTNDPGLTQKMAPTLRRIAPRVVDFPGALTADDIAYFQEKVPGLFFHLGINPPGVATAEPNHSPRFFIHEEALGVGVRALAGLTVDYLSAPAAAPGS